MELILSNIEKHICLSEKHKSLVISKVEERSVEKKEFVQQAGDPCRYIHFVSKGILRAFFIGPDGKDSTLMFATSDWWITDMDSFLNECQAVVNIQVVTPATIFSLSKKSLDSLFDEVPAFNTFFRILMQNAYCREQRRSIQTLSMTAKERYDQFNEKYPEVASKVTQKQIASYLGITPEFLSHIRAQRD